MLPKPPPRSAVVRSVGITERLPPSDIGAEKQVLGSILISPDKMDQIASILKGEDFYSNANEIIYRTMLALHGKGEKIDIVLLANRLQRKGHWESIGGAAYLAEVAQSVAVAAHAEHYARIVLRASQKRQILNATIALMSDCWDLDVDPEQSLADAEVKLSAIKTGSVDTDEVPVTDAIADAVIEIDEIARGKRSRGILTGVLDLDKYLGGLFPGELSILAARPSQGKTSLALQICCHVAKRHNVYLATLEMARSEIVLKRMCSLANVSSQRVRTGSLTKDEQRRLVDASVEMSASRLFIHDWPDLRPYDIQRAAKRCKADLIVVDYLQYLQPPDMQKKRYEQVGDISRALKTIARRLNVPVLACAQIGRQADSIAESKPRLYHLRESGNIENDADVAMLLWRPHGGIADGPRVFDAQVEIAKNRNGPTAQARLMWSAERTLFLCPDECPMTDNSDPPPGDRF